MTTKNREKLIKLWEDYLAPFGDVYLFSDIIDLTHKIYGINMGDVTKTEECQKVIKMYERHRSNPVMKALE